MKIGILELINGSLYHNRIEHIYSNWVRKQFVSIMPQAVAVWCRRLGHSVFYATYYGQQDPKSLLPDDLDIVFICSFTQASVLAYALARLYRREKTLTVLGGPHAKAFPTDSLRFFDFVVQECDKRLVEDILQSSFDRHTILRSSHPLTEFPSVEERFPEIAMSSFTQGRPPIFGNVPMLTSVGCPYKCNFCVDWDKPYVQLPLESLKSDLNYISKYLSKVTVAFHDPNFGVHFDQVLDILETLPEKNRNPYAMGCSLSILKGSRLPRLKRTNCIYVGPGVESWQDYATKAATGSAEGREKMEKVVAHFKELYPYVPSLGACFIFGTDTDKGDEPIELTKEFIHRIPSVWPGINIPTPFGGTPLYESYLSEDRILKRMPFRFYFTPYLVFKLKHYNPLEYYEKFTGLISYATSFNIMTRRVSGTHRFPIKILQFLRTLALRNQLSEMRRIQHQLKSDKKFRAFHEGDSKKLPDFYRQRLVKSLGAYAELISDADMMPVLEERNIGSESIPSKKKGVRHN